MDQDTIQETKEKVQNWLADGRHRRCCKVALGVANALVLTGLTAGMALLCLIELRRGGCHRSCCHPGNKP